jgi:Tol biopolymer transport system component
MFILSVTLSGFGQTQNLGLFSGSGDIGNPLLKGKAVYSETDQSYLLSGGGNNIWLREDQFHFLYKKIKGDFIISATVKFIGKGVAGHRKIGIMAREELTKGSKYADGALHGGLPLNTSLQYRLTSGDTTGQIVISTVHPTEIEFERSGNTFAFSAATAGEIYKSVTKEVAMNEEVYAGLFICSHLDTVREQALFTNVRIIIPPARNFVPYQDYIGSYLETMDISTGHRMILKSEKGSIQCPNWSKDGKSLIYNSAEGLLYNYDIGTGVVKKINSGSAIQNNNDHVISPDGKMIAISNYVGPNHKSTIFIMPLEGTDNPTKISSEDSGHSYLHSWSPDGKNIIFTGQRNDEWDIWSINIDTKKEKNLTNFPGLDDGSEYSPDGKWIYFNAVRTGTMQIWRMRPDGTEQEQVTFDEYNNWFPHFSPDGKWIVYESFPKDIDPLTHPFYKRVYLRIMPASGGIPRIIAYIYGGQGSINVPSWSPDSKKIAFITNTKIE